MFDDDSVSGIAYFGHHAVLDQGDKHHVPLAAVADWVGEQVVHGAAVNRAIRQVNHGGQEEIRLLQLVPEMQVILRELEVRQLVSSYTPTGTNQPREQPASPDFFWLVFGHRSTLTDIDGSIGHDLAIQRDLRDRRFADGLLHDVGRLVCGKVGGVLLQFRWLAIRLLHHPFNASLSYSRRGFYSSGGHCFCVVAWF